MPTRKPLGKDKLVVAILNTSVELIEALDMAFEDAGFDTVTTTVSDLKRGNITIEELFDGIKPVVIVYDIALPYQENWDYLQKIRTVAQVGDARFILTTTNKKALEDIIGQDSHAFEIKGLVDKPFELADLLEMVVSAAEEVENQRNTRSEHAAEK